MSKQYFKITYIIIFCLMVFSLSGFSQKSPAYRTEPVHTRILFIFDASNSMWGDWQSDKKIHIANRLLSKMIDSLENYPGVELALRVYGHQKDFRLYDCNDTKLEVPFAPNNFERIKQKLKSISPKGTTPIGQSLLAAQHDFPSTENVRNVIILITDGIEECQSDPCEISQTLQRNGIILKPYVIGLGKDFSLDLSCIGTYIDATSESAFDKALSVIVEQIFNKTTCQVNLLDAYGKPLETNVPISFFDEKDSSLMYNYIHTMNARGVPDTLLLNTMLSYRIKVHSLPPVEVSGIKLNVGTHNIIPIDLPQGALSIKSVTKNSRYQFVPAIVRKKGEHEIVNVQYFNQIEKYIVGSYDLEILCLPRLYINNVEIKQNSTSNIKIPDPGVAIVKKNNLGFGSLFVVRDGKDEWIYNLRNEDSSESILLLPGTYKVVFREASEYQTTKTKEVTFVVKSNATTTVNVSQF